jgi:hypothetical protein
VKNRFQTLPQKFNLQRYSAERVNKIKRDNDAVGLCTLNQVDP